MGSLPSKEELEEFRQVIGQCRSLPTNFTRDVIMKAPTDDIMNSMTRIAGWSAHRIEELVTGRRIIRLAYMSEMEELS